MALQDLAHQIFNETSIYEVIDMDRGAAMETLLEFYESVDGEAIDKYLDVVELLRVESENECTFMNNRFEHKT